MSTSPITVRVNPSLKLSQCTVQESSRYALAGVMVEPVLGTESVAQGVDSDGKPCNFTDQPVNEVYVVATDSRCLAVTRQPGLAVDTAIMPGRFATPAKKTSKSKAVSLNGQWVSEETHRTKHTTESTALPIVEGRFPRYQDVLPRPSRGDTVSIRLDAELLSKVAQAITDGVDHKGIDLVFQTVQHDGQTHIDTDGPVGLAGINGVGAIMPIDRVDQNTREPIGSYSARSHTVSISRYRDFLDAMTANAKAENTPERKAQVLALLNPAAETTA